MKKIKNLSILIAVLMVIPTCKMTQESSMEMTKYEPTWESLMQKDGYPQWYQDAVLGFYFHWGPYSVPGFGCAGYWTMYIKDSRNYNLVKEKYGEPGVEFGYKDFVPMWKADKYDPDEWVDGPESRLERMGIVSSADIVESSEEDLPRISTGINELCPLLWRHD